MPDPTPLTGLQLPSFGDIFNAAPVVSIVCGVVFFGFWLRKGEVLSLKEDLKYLRRLVASKMGVHIEEDE